MTNLQETQRIKDFIKQYKNILEDHLTPITLLDYLPFLKDEDSIAIRNIPMLYKRQVGIFLTAFESCSQVGTLQAFLDALFKSKDQYWLFPLLSGNLLDEELCLYLKDLDMLKQVKELLTILKPHLNSISVEDCLNDLGEWFSNDEKEFLLQKCQNDGNHYAVAFFIYALARKKKDCIKEFCNHLKENHSGFAGKEGTMGQVANLILDCMGIDNKEQCFKKEQSQKNCNLSSSFNSYHEEGFEDFDESNISLKDLNVTIEDTDLSILQHEDVDTIINEEVKENDGENFDDSLQGNENIQLRGYQKELVQPAKDKKNVIICAPPGSGKTLVAAHIVQHYLETCGNLNKSVLFFTPGSALAQQQSKRLANFLPNEFNVDSCYGRTEESSLEMHDAHVIVLTPQILLNALQNKAKENPIKSIGQYGLLIFDECHHCMKGHPYNGVMREYFCFYHKAIELEEEVPQVVGLTATLGIGKKSTEAQNQILQLCSNLNAVDGIVTVQDPENVKELYQCISLPDEDSISLKDRNNDPFNMKLIADMNQFVKLLQTLEDFKPPPYEDIYANLDALKQWCVNTKNEVAKAGPQNSRDPISCIEYIEYYGEARDLHLKCRACDAVRHLEKFIDEKIPDNPSEIEKTLNHIIQDSLTNHLKPLCTDRRCINPNLYSIHDIILDKFRKEPTSTGMLMTKKRIYAHALKEWMNETSSLKFLNPEVFVGISKSATSGLNHNQQEAVMKSFRDGNHKVIICTPDSAGEGIDVSGCNFVINYDYLKTEVGMIQIKGRVRKIGGEVIELCSPKVAQRDRLNAHKTEIMEEATREVQDFLKKNPSAYKKKLLDLQEEARISDEQAMRAKLAKQQINSEKEFQLKCRKCREDICSSRDIKLVDGGKYINATKRFKEKYRVKEHPKRGDMGRDWKKKSKVHCCECDNDWGIEAVWKDCITLPLIKIEGMVVVDNSTGKACTPRKWKNAPFIPDSVDLAEMMNDLNWNDFA